MKNVLKEYAIFAEVLADASGQVARTYYRNISSVEWKSDKSPVTIADREIEKVLRTMLSHAFPAHGIIGEEFGGNIMQSGCQWLLDPIDGTASFMIGRPIFGTLIAMAYEGVPMVGIIDQPIVRDRWVGMRGGMTRCNGKPTKVRECALLSEAVLCTTALHYFSLENQEKFLQVAARCKHVVYGGDCYNYALLSSGLVDIVIETGLKPHDFCALVPVVEAAGGVVMDWQGQPISLFSDGNIIAVSSKSLAEKIITILN